MKHKFKNTKNRNFLIVMTIILFIILGIIVGSFFANSLPLEKQQSLFSYIDKYFDGYNINVINRSDVFKECFIKYGKISVIIWLLAFIPIGFILTLGIIFLKGMSYGFTTSFLVIGYGLKGIYFSCLLYLFQNIVLIPVYIFISFASIKFSVKDNKNILEYSVFLIIALSCVILASLIEAYVVPTLIT